MKTVLGSQPTEKPDGMLRQIIFPQLAMMDTMTGDGRLLKSEGKGARELPRTIYGQFINSYGHMGAVVVGALHEITFEDDGRVSGRGWAIDDESGRQAVLYIKTQALRHNSVDLNDVQVSWRWDEELDDIVVEFEEWKIGATTLVGKPAFADARAELLEDEDLVASWMAEEDPLVVDVPLEINFVVAPEAEVTADSSKRPPWELFHMPEPDEPHPIWIGEMNEAGFYPVTGHVALWDTCHDGLDAKCVIPPRPDDGFAHYNQPGVLTDKGAVGTGPIFLTGGHRRGASDLQKAYGGVENTWADVHVIAGRHGPWASGYVRPGTSDEKVVAARASRVSGHWKGNRLKAVVSVNSEGFEVPGNGFTLDEDGNVVELIASFPACAKTTNADSAGSANASDEPPEPDHDDPDGAAAKAGRAKRKRLDLALAEID